MIKLFWKKLSDNAVIPTKTAENIGYDIYHTYEGTFHIGPHETKLVPTGLAVAIIDENIFGFMQPSKDFALIAKDRGSTGSIGLHTYCGVIDSGYRGEIFIALHNSNDVPVVFDPNVSKTKREYDDFGMLESIHYPFTKAIAQLILVESYHVESLEIEDEETWKSLCNTERGEGKLGSSNK